MKHQILLIGRQMVMEKEIQKHTHGKFLERYFLIYNSVWCHNKVQVVDADNPKDEHRHISHLYGLYPSNQISPTLNPQLFQAARNTLLQRGDMATGWSIGWKINFWARMLDGNHAFNIIRK